MAKRSKKKRAVPGQVLLSGPISKDGWLWVALLLAAVTFWVYWPSLKSSFVYDAQKEIIEEGFVTSLSNLPDVLSLKVVGTNLMLKDRPGQILYLMFNAVIWGKEPFGYHLSSNLLQAANVALLFVLLHRLISTEITGLDRRGVLKVQLVAAVATLIFALHPIAVESVAEVSYCASLLVTFFTLLALLMATYFRPGNFRIALLTGGAGVLCAFAAVISKESGVAVAPLLIVYWFLFRRRETRGPWLVFLSTAMAVTIVFLAALFFLSVPNKVQLNYLGGSFFQVFLNQPRLLVFMIGKLFWPMQLSADYAPVEALGPSTIFSLAVFLAVVLGQIWLARRSRMGALGVAIYWLGLVTVSNLVPLYHPTADRFYHLPLVGVALQLLALLTLAMRWRVGFWVVVTPLLGALLPLAFLTVARENVFADDFSLWSDTLQVSPLSPVAHAGLGWALYQKGAVDEAVIHYEKALEINPNFTEARNNLGMALCQKGEVDEAIVDYEKVLEITPGIAEVHNNFGLALVQKGEVDQAIVEYRKALELNPNFVQVHNNLGIALARKGEVDEAIAQYQLVLKISPNLAEAHNNLGTGFAQKGRMEEALAQFEEAVQLKPGYSEAQSNVAKAKVILSQGRGSGSK